MLLAAKAYKTAGTFKNIIGLFDQSAALKQRERFLALFNGGSEQSFSLIRRLGRKVRQFFRVPDLKATYSDSAHSQVEKLSLNRFCGQLGTQRFLGGYAWLVRHL